MRIWNKASSTLSHFLPGTGAFRSEPQSVTFHPLTFCRFEGVCEHLIQCLSLCHERIGPFFAFFFFFFFIFFARGRAEQPIYHNTTTSSTTTTTTIMIIIIFITIIIVTFTAINRQFSVAQTSDDEKHLQRRKRHASLGTLCNCSSDSSSNPVSLSRCHSLTLTETLIPVVYKVPKSHTWVKVKIPSWKMTQVKVKVTF